MSYHPADFSGYRHSGSRNIIVFVFHVTLQDFVTMAFVTLLIRALQDKSPSYQVTWP